MNIEGKMRVLRCRRWVMDHNIPPEVILKMEELTLTAPKEIFSWSTEAVLRRIYTQACRELKNG